MPLSLRTYLLIFLLKDVFLFILYLRGLRSYASAPLRRVLPAALAGVFLAMDVPLMLVLVGGGRWGWPPSGDLWHLYTYTVHTWHFTGLMVAAAAAAWLTLAALCKVGRSLWRRCTAASPTEGVDTGADAAVDASRAPLPPDPCPEVSDPVDGASPSRGRRPAFTRREMVKAAFLSMPPLLFAGAFAGALRQRGRFEVHKLTVTIPGLPAELRGMTITHISDMHIGRLVDDALLEPIVRRADELHSDLVVVTGDVVDHNNAFLPSCIAAFNRIHAPLGLYCCMGNHDHIHDGPAFARALRAADVHGQGDATLLLNQSVVLRRNGRPFVLGGIDWARDDARLAELTGRAFAGSDPTLPRILLSHHPHAFDPAVERDVLLTLAGHTHGGQLVFRRSDDRIQLDRDTVLHTGRTFAAGHLLYRYVEGLYERAGRFLFVSRGIGNWFPWRLNCPAEMTQITLG